MKSQRQAKILEIIGQKDIETQEQLLAALEENGFRSTQATISRDIKDLRIVKELSDSGSYRYTVQQAESASFVSRLNNIFHECVIKLDHAQNIVVIFCGLLCGGQHGYQLCGGHHCRRRYGADSDAGFRLCQRIL